MTHSRFVRGIIAAVVLLGGSVFAVANMEPNDKRIMQYSGTLRSAGVAETGTYDFRAGLFLTDTDLNAPGCLLNDPPDCATWSSEIPAVDVVAGAFGLTLGGDDSLSDSVLAQAPLYLALAVREQNDTSFSLLEGFQRIVPSPLASRAAAAKDFKVTGALTVGGTADLGPTVVDSLDSVGAVTAGGGVSATGNVAATQNVTAGGAVSATGNLGGSRLSLANGVIQRGGTPTTLTSDLGLYSQVAGNWMRFVSNQGPIRFFTDGNVSVPGSTQAFSVEADGRLSWSFNESATTALLPDRFCVVVHVNDTTCPAGWTARFTKWDTEDSSNSDSKDGVIAVDNGNTGSVLMRFCCRGSGL